MNISFIGVAKKHRARYESAIRFYGSILMEPDIHETLNVELHLSKKFDQYGQTLNDDFLTNRPQFFKIELRTEVDDEPLLTLAHEMVHVKQYAMGELTLDFITENIQLLKLKGLKVKPMWMDKVVSFRDCESPYWDSPWEVEAYGRQNSLYERFIDYEQMLGIL